MNDDTNDSPAPSNMRVAVTGASGLIGSPLVAQLSAAGHQITRLVRRDPTSDDEVRWDPDGEHTDVAALGGMDAIVHLAGENIAGGRWTPAMKQRIRESRVGGTKSLSEDLARLADKPNVLVCASAIGYYGDRGDETLVESSPPGESFLCNVVKDWEAATQPAVDAGIRVVNMRIGVVLSSAGGALAKMLTPFKLGVGGRVGGGQQFWSWVSRDDAVAAMVHALHADELRGPVNATSPNPVTNLEFTKTLGAVLCRPTIFPMPAFAARLLLGEMADELLLASQRVQPEKLLNSNFQFQHSDLESALRHVLDK